MALTFAMSAASSMMQHQAQNAQADHVEKQNVIARQQIENDAAQRVMDGERQRAGEYEQAASEANALQAQAMRERATLDALLGEYGAGNTGERRLAALGTQQGQDLATVRANAGRRQSELGFGQSSDVASIRSRVTSLPTPMRPSKAGLALTIAGHAVSAAGRMGSINNPKPGAGIA